MGKIERLANDFQIINEIKESYENDPICNGEEIIEKANELLTVLDRMVVNEARKITRQHPEIISWFDSSKESSTTSDNVDPWLYDYHHENTKHFIR